MKTKDEISQIRYGMKYADLCDKRKKVVDVIYALYLKEYDGNRR
jgi:hypothetical protein